MIRSGVRRLLHRAGYDVTRWPVQQTGYTRDAVLQRLLVDRGITHLLDVGAADGVYGTAVRALGFTGTLVSFAPSNGGPLGEIARSDGRWDVHAVTLGAVPGSIRVDGERVSVARLDDRFDTVVPKTAVVLLRLATGADLAVLKGAEKVLPRVSVVESRGPVDDERLAWLGARGFRLAGLFPVAGDWDYLGAREP